MRRSRVAALMMPVLAVTLASCGRVEGPPLYPVQGKVIFKGQPASGATVLFRREDPEPNTTPLVPTGLVDDEGMFTLAVEQRGRRCPGREICRPDPVEEPGGRRGGAQARGPEEGAADDRTRQARRRARPPARCAT